MLAKAREIKVEELIIDLEDAVTPDRKPEALRFALEALAAGNAAARVAVRINPPATRWAADEVRALVRAATRPSSVILPKSEDPDELADVVSSLDGIDVQALVETAAGLTRVDELARVAGVEGLIIGYADLAVSLGRTPAGASDLDLWLAAQDRVLTAARAAGIRAIDGPYLNLEDEAGLTRAATRAADLGFDGKWAIHPKHVEAIAAAFRPDPEAIERAHQVIAALRDAPANGAVEVDGQMVDEPVRLAALRTLQLAGVDPEDPR